MHAELCRRAGQSQRCVLGRHLAELAAQTRPPQKRPLRHGPRGDQYLERAEEPAKENGCGDHATSAQLLLQDQPSAQSEHGRLQGHAECFDNGRK